ncbi:MAG: tRNA (guanosine(46)-N7)-methyltransferase TrmB [Clostridia bacterium]|nr:tRNA (guanosine(46)-N7)-methyltransferase TrmB [Clostridia bacterium]
MRKKKNGEARLAACRDALLDAPAVPMADPAAVFGKSGAPVFLEIGAGKGGFANGMTKAHPECCYFAMERVSDCVVLAAELWQKREVCRPDNLRFIVDTADNLTKIFDTGTVDRIFLNFSDPWSKKGYAKRRLTHRRYLAVYLNLLKDGGEIFFKTDNVGLFDFSLDQIAAIGLTPEVVTRDLHASEWNEGNIMTEYETAFSAQGIKINMLRLKKPQGFKIDIPEELSRDRKDYRG